MLRKKLLRKRIMIFLRRIVSNKIFKLLTFFKNLNLSIRELIKRCSKLFNNYMGPLKIDNFLKNHQIFQNLPYYSMEICNFYVLE